MTRSRNIDAVSHVRFSPPEPTVAAGHQETSRSKFFPVCLATGVIFFRELYGTLTCSAA